MSRKILNSCIILVLMLAALTPSARGVQAQEPIPNIDASVTGDWLQIWGIGPDVLTARVEILRGEGQDLVCSGDYDEFSENPWLDCPESGIDPGDHIFLYLNDFQVKDHIVLDMTLDEIDVVTGLVRGTGPQGLLVDTVICNPEQDCFSGQVEVLENGTWEIFFGPDTIFLGAQIWATIWEADGDSTQANLITPPFPSFEIQPDHGWVCTGNWGIGVPVTLTIDGSPISTYYHQETKDTIQAEWDPNVGEVCFDLYDEAEQIQPGMFVSVSDGTTTKDTLIREMSFDSVNEFAVASGTALYPGQGHACLGFGGEYLCQEISVETTNEWFADFGPFGPVLENLTEGHVVIPDLDGDATRVDLDLPEPPPMPIFGVHPEHGWVSGGGWPLDILVELTITDPEEGTIFQGSQISEEDEWNPGVVWFDLDLSPEQLHPGVIVSLSDGDTTKVMEIVPLSFDSIDPDGNATGIGPAGGYGHVCLDHESECQEIEVSPDGEWTATFDWYTPDMTELYDAHVVIWDEDGDETVANYPMEEPPQLPAFTVQPDHGWVCTNGWQIGEWLTVTIASDEDFNDIILEDYQQAVPASWDENVGEFCFEFYDEADLIQSGQFVRVAGVDFTKTTKIIYLTFDAIDPETYLAYGSGGGTGHVYLEMDDENWFNREIFWTSTTTWGADFSDYLSILDIDRLIEAHVVVWDEDGDETMANLPMEEPPPVPAFAINPDHGWVNGWNWPLDVELTLTIDTDQDPGNGFIYQGADYASPWEWDPNTGEIWFDLYEIADQIEVGMYVSLTDGVVTKDTWIANVTFDSIDPITLIANGTRPGDLPGYVCLQFDPDYICHEITDLTSGFWQVDFSDDSINLDNLTDANVAISDGDGDETVANLYIPPMPYIRLNLTTGSIRALGWPLDSDLTLKIYDGATEVLSVAGTVTGYAPWEEGLTMWQIDEVGLDLPPGFLIKVSDSENEFIKEVTVTSLSIEAVDYGENTATGSTGPNSMVELLALGVEIEGLTVESDEDGNWTAYFTIDLIGEETLLIMEWDDDGDSTEVRWFPNLPPEAIDDTYSTDEDNILSEPAPGVLSNDNDPENSTLVVVLVNGVQHGSLLLNSDGSFSYTPDQDYFGSDSFSYYASDGVWESEEAVVYLTVNTVNDVPQVDAGPDVTLDEGQIFNGTASFTDPDLDPWTATVDYYSDGVDVQDLPVNQEKTFVLSNEYPFDNGLYVVTVTVNDGMDQGSDSLEVTINNVAPNVEITSLADGKDTVLAGLEVGLVVSFTDPSEDTHTAVVNWGDGSQSIDPALSPFAVSHVYQVAGTYPITVTVTDDDGGAGSAAASLMVVDPAEAAQSAIEDLESILTNPDINPEIADALEDAIVELEGANDGASNGGAIDKIDGGQWNAALVKIIKAIQDLEEAEDADPNLDFNATKELLAFTAKSVALEVIELAEAVASKPIELAKIQEAYELIAQGQVLLEAGDYLGAVEKFQDALGGL